MKTTRPPRAVLVSAIAVIVSLFVPAVAMAKYLRLDLVSLAAGAEAIAVGTITRVDADFVLVGVEDGVTDADKDLGAIRVRKFEDWPCAQRWTGYRKGQTVLLFLARKGDRLVILGAGGEGEVPADQDHVYFPARDAPGMAAAKHHVHGTSLESVRVRRAEVLSALRDLKDCFALEVDGKLRLHARAKCDPAALAERRARSAFHGLLFAQALARLETPPAAPAPRAAPPEPAASGEPITIETLLAEMLDREALARWPAPPHATRQASSRDRRSVAPGEPGWFANIDTGKYLREEANGGRQEWVMMEAAGPGAIVRWWAGGTTPDLGPPGTVRIYLDGSTTPAIEGTFDALLGGKLLVGPPLAAIRSIGRNLYLPIPYANGCKVTYDRPPLGERIEGLNAHWYVIEHRVYPAGTTVRSFTHEDLVRARPALDRVQAALLSPGNDSAGDLAVLPARHATLAPGAALAQEIEGSRAIRRLAVKVQAPGLAQALRSTVLVLTFDGERTVWCPVGDFFGTGIGLNPYRDWWRDVDRSGLLTSYWVMPFARSARLELLNLGAEPVDVILGAVAHGPWAWDDRSLRFHADWRQEAGMATRKADGFDWNYLTARGQGIYAGDTLVLRNGAGPWWGEGDEKVFVDGESFPSFFGTGTEDYYGYSYGDRGVFFEAPFHAHPLPEGNARPGWVAVTRTRSLDAIPFTASLRFDMEVWHWSQTRVTYAAATYWYGRPGAKSERAPSPEEAARGLPSIAAADG